MQKTDVSIDLAGKLIDDFLARTGISSPVGEPRQRYLWTDAFAVQACFALSHLLENDEYLAHARRLIESVHEVLGRFRPDDERQGWLSGLPEDEGKKFPTRGGLRIGKDLPERKPGEPVDQMKEWERDGQYFHYLTRWFNTLMQAAAEFQEPAYAHHAAGLIRAGEAFLQQRDGQYRMVWKMNTDLTKPAVESMGTHDPLEGLVCTIRALHSATTNKSALQELKSKFENSCTDMNWFTDDSLGVGGLLLNCTRGFEFRRKEIEIPDCIQPERLLLDSLTGLRIFSEDIFNPQQPAEARLAFRECGLSLGMNVLLGFPDDYKSFKVNVSKLEKYLPLVNEIEGFWMQEENRQQKSWTSHKDINAVTLACSLLARDYPGAFI